MESVAALSAGQASSYYTDAKDNYYTRDATVNDKWQGKGCVDVGLVDGHTVDPEAYKLMINQSGRTCPAYDCTFSAPKSVSVLAELGTDKARADMMAAHQQAVTETMTEIERTEIGCRVTENGVTRFEHGNMIAAKFEHNLSRAEDPDIHTHCVVLNRTQHNGKTYALDGSRLYGTQKIYGTEYRSRLAVILQEKGYNIEVTDPEKGFWEVKGVSRETLNHFSKRRKEIETAMEADGVTTAKAAQSATMKTRIAKKHTDLDQLRQVWREELTRVQLEGLPEVGTGKIPRASTLDRKAAYVAAVRDLEESTFAFTAKQLETGALARGVGVGMTRADVQAFAAKDGALYRGELAEGSELDQCTVYYTTQRNLDADQRVRDRYYHQQSMDNNITPSRAQNLLSKVQEGADFQLNKEQTAAAARMLSTKAQYTVVHGYAGTGKTTLVERFRWAAAAHNKIVTPDQQIHLVAMSPGGKAVDGLKTESGIKDGGTIHSFLGKLEGKPRDPAQTGIKQSWDFSGVQKCKGREIWICDEAGTMPTLLMDQLQTAADKRGAQVVFLGDVDQHPPVGGGEPLRDFVDHDKKFMRQGGEGNTVFLKDIRRQQDAELLAAVRESVEGDHLKSFEALDAKGDYREIKSTSTRTKAVVREMVGTTPVSEYKHNLLLVGTNADRKRYNAAIRAEYVRRGELDKGQEYTVEVNKGERVRAEKVNFAKNERVMFTRNDKHLGVNNGTLGVIKGIEGNRFTVENDAGKTISFDIAGDKAYKALQPAWAVTSHKAQGMSIDKMGVDMDPRMASRNAFYVAISRAKKRAVVFTSSKPKLESATRKWAHKISKKDFSSFKQRGGGKAKPILRSVASAGKTAVRTTAKVGIKMLRMGTKVLNIAGKVISFVPVVGKPVSAVLSAPDTVARAADSMKHKGLKSAVKDGAKNKAISTAKGVAKNTEKIINDIQKKLTDENTKQDLTAKARKPKTLIEDLKKATKDAILGTQKNLEIFEKKMPKAKSSGLESFGKQNPFEKAAAAAKILEREL